MKKILLLFLIIGLGFSAYPQADDGIKFRKNESWSKMLQLAKDQKKLIFMDCYTTWCAPCKGLNERIFTQKIVGDYFNSHFVNVQYDMEKGEGIELGKKYKNNIVGYPTLLLIDSTGKVVHQMAGYMEANVLLDNIQLAGKGKSLSSYDKRYDQGERSLDFLKEYVAKLKSAYKKDRIKEVVMAYLSDRPVQQLSDPETWNLVGEYITDPLSRPYRYVLENLNKYDKSIQSTLEVQLRNGMESLVSKIIYPDSKGNTVNVTDDQMEMLKGMLRRNVLNNSSQSLIRLKFKELKDAGKIDQLYDYAVMVDDMGLFGKKNGTREIYEYVVEHSKNREILTRILKDTFEEINTVPTKDLNFNCYKLIGLCYKSLGDVGKSEQYLKMYNQKYADYMDRNKDLLILMKAMGGK